MPRSKRNTAKSPAPVAKEEVPATRRARGAPVVETPSPKKSRTRGAAAPVVETPSPKKSRKTSPSPAPRGRSRGRGTKEPETKQEQGQGDDVEEPSPKKGRITRAVVQEEEAPSRGRASSRKAAEPKKAAPSPAPKGRSSSRQKAAPTPTKAEEPKAETSRSRSRSKPTKPEPKTPEPKPAKAKSRPKSQTKKTPAKKATPSPRKAPVKPKPSPKPAASRSRSRGNKDEEASDMPSAQLILTKIDSPSKSNNTSLAETEEETISPSRSRGRSSSKTSPQKASPKTSRRSKSSEKSTPPTRRGRRSAEAEEEVDDEVEEEAKEEDIEEKEKVEDTKDEESAECDEANKDEDMDTKDATAEIGDVVEKKESDDVQEKETEVEEEVSEEMKKDEKEEVEEEMKEEESKDGKEEENEMKEAESEELQEEDNKDVKDAEPEAADVEETDDKQEEVSKEEEDEVANEEEEPCEPKEEEPALEPSPPFETSPAKESSTPAAEEECKPPEIEAISDDDVEEEKEEPMEEDVVEEHKEEESKDTAAAPAVEEPVAAAMADGEQQNGSPDDPLSSPSRKRKWDELDDEGEDLSPKKVRRSIDMADVTSEGVVTTNGEDQMSKQETVEESMETIVDQKEPEVAQTSTASHNIEQEYVVVNMDEIPAANSTEVLQCLPTETPKEEEAAPVLAAEQSPSIAPAVEVVSDVNQEQQTAAETSTTSEFNPVLSRKYIPNPSYHPTGDTNKQFSVVSYNILAQCHLERNDYTFTESQYLAESYRHQNLLKEIEYLGADLVCMQEVGPSYYESLLKPAMTRLGYEGVIKKRTQEYFNEGEATFYRTSRFSVVETRTYSLKDLAEQELEDGGVSEDVKVSIRRYLDLPDVLVLTKLRCNSTGNVLCMGNIHVQWGKMEIPDAQCIQIVCAIKELAKQGGSDCHAQILCGDFNSEVTSPGYKLAMEGYLNDELLKQLQALENLEMPDSSKAPLVNNLWSAFQHTSDLKSAYQSAQGSEPVVTSYNQVMLAAVDYIFYCGSNLHNVGVLETAHEKHIKATGGIPDRLFPSDHVSIKAVFAFS